MPPALYILFGLGVVAFLLSVSYGRWQALTDRERFLLGMKQASTPGRMTAEETTRLRLLRSPWWAFWRWVPDLWRRCPPV